eukprot:6143632-Alexandrium_andersonii.AAC.1
MTAPVSSAPPAQQHAQHSIEAVSTTSVMQSTTQLMPSEQQWHSIVPQLMHVQASHIQREEQADALFARYVQ